MTTRMTTRVPSRRSGRSGSPLLRAGLVGALLLVPVGCTAAPSFPTVAPIAAPSDAASTPNQDPSPGADCVVRSSYPPSQTRPGSILKRWPGKGLVVGVDPSDPTMSYWDAVTQRFEGFNIDLVVAVARAIWPNAPDPRSRITFKMVRPGEGPFEMLKQGQVDFIATSLTASCKRAEEVIFSDDYLDSGQTALVRLKDGRPEYAGIDRLGGKKVCAAAKTTSLAAVAAYRTKDGDRLKPVQAAHPIDCLVMLRQGQVDAVSTDENILLGLARMAPDTALVTEPPWNNARYCKHHKGESCTWFTDEPHAFAFARDNPESLALLRFVNYVLKSTRASGVWQKAHDKWLAGHPDKGMPIPCQAVTSWPPPGCKAGA